MNSEDKGKPIEAAKQTIRSMGGEVNAKMVLAIASGGNVRTETHRLFTEDEYRKIISALP